MAQQSQDTAVLGGSLLLSMPIQTRPKYLSWQPVTVSERGERERVCVTSMGSYFECPYSIQRSYAQTVRKFAVSLLCSGPPNYERLSDIPTIMADSCNQPGAFQQMNLSLQHLVNYQWGFGVQHSDSWQSFWRVSYKLLFKLSLVA